MSDEKQIDDGGPAFPKTGNFNNDQSGEYDSVDREGMTLRDWFAGQALAGWFASPACQGSVEDSAIGAYKAADAMLAARKQEATKSNPTDTPRLPRVATWDMALALFAAGYHSGHHDTVEGHFDDDPRGQDSEYYHGERVAEILDDMEAPALPADWASLAAWLDRKAAWSRETFGPVNMPDDALRILRHMDNEMNEICDAVNLEETENINEECADMILLAFDMMHRNGLTGEQAIGVVTAKQAVNTRRTWPDWRTADPTMPMEHVEGGRDDAEEGLPLLDYLASLEGQADA
jgi:NTP pyrophosphatase (non-canonical NTP hydrolase)